MGIILKGVNVRVSHQLCALSGSSVIHMRSPLRKTMKSFSPVRSSPIRLDIFVPLIKFEPRQGLTNVIRLMEYKFQKGVS